MAVHMTNIITPVVTGGAYSDKDALGPVTAIPSVPKSGTIMSFMLIDDSDSTFSFELYLFNSAISGVADNAAFVLTDAETQSIVGYRDHFTSAPVFANPIDNRVFYEQNLAMPYYTPNGILYFQLAIQDASPPTLGAVDDIHIRLGIVY